MRPATLAISSSPTPRMAGNHQAEAGPQQGDQAHTTQLATIRSTIDRESAG
ncbi:hypothetical protein HMPREF0682_2151 [Propionibacterium acidifaciens F0233]|uniref:Uncharacterized protein n=1 Tax=Propionibacterium acidifaciens F0233 TaxID=553198 RepID=U2QAT2_9ACTN|nr:hypothetical protein HMPREF0682_2151 [Propionibacterium acidifaciens F0233]